MSNHRVIELAHGKKRFSLIAGLEWHPLQEVGSARGREIADYARSVGAEFKVLRPGDTHHVGLASKAGGARAGQISLAGLIAESILADGRIRNALVALELPEQGDVILVTLRNGVILPDGDKVAGADASREQLLLDAAYEGGWDLIVCPSQWGVPASEERVFAEVVDLGNAAVVQSLRLREVRIAWQRFLVPLVVVAVLAAGGSYGWKAWKLHKAKELARQMALAEEQRRIAERPVESPRPWAAQPSPMAFAAACQSGMDKLGTDAGNWTFFNASCEGGVVSVTWQKGDDQAWISHLVAMRPGAVISADGVAASLSIALGVLPAAPPEELPKGHPARIRLYDIASQYGLAILVEPLQKTSGTVGLPGQVVDDAPASAPWTAYSVTVTSTLDPVEVARLLAMPGLRLNRIVSTQTDGETQYKFSGVQYVQS